MKSDRVEPVAIIGGGPAGLTAGLAVITATTFLVRRLGKKLPLRVLFALTMGIGAYMSIAFMGNAVREFQVRPETVALGGIVRIANGSTVEAGHVLVHPGMSRQHLSKGRFAGTVWPDYAGRRTCFDFKADVFGSGPRDGSPQAEVSSAREPRPSAALAPRRPARGAAQRLTGGAEQ